MEMTSGKKAIDKIFKRRNRYEIPDWQREGDLWDRDKKQSLIDSILRRWRLPKFYFIKVSEDQFQVEDGQQRLLAIYEFCGDELPLSPASTKEFGGQYYSKLPQTIAEAFDDFEIEYDLIENATDEELKDFFQRLQAGLPLTSSEKLNAVHGKLRDFVRTISKHDFFAKSICIPNTRYSHFDIAAKVLSIEIEGLDSGLRFEDIKAVFESSANFSASSAVAKRVKAALNFLDAAFRKHGKALRTRTVVQSLITLTCKLIETGRANGFETDLRDFFQNFMENLNKQIEMGQSATDSEYITFQRSVNANVKGGARTRHSILLRKLLTSSPKLADLFDPSVVTESGVSGRISALGESISDLIEQINKKYELTKGQDLFKPTNKTTQAQLRIRKPINTLENYKTLIDDLYFQFRESVGQRLADAWPASFNDVNDLRTDLRHDIDHGDEGKVRSKRQKIGRTFVKYAGQGTPETLDPTRLPLVQANLLGAIEGDLRVLLSSTP